MRIRVVMWWVGRGSVIRLPIPAIMRWVCMWWVVIAVMAVVVVMILMSIVCITWGRFIIGAQQSRLAKLGCLLWDKALLQVRTCSTQRQKYSTESAATPDITGDCMEA